MQPVDRGSVSRRHAPDSGLPATATAYPGRPADVRSIAPVAPARSRARALLALARPRQWVKNVLVIAAPGAAGALGRDDVLGRVLIACIAFCLISGGIYALNDVQDRHEDRRHPRKRLRPVAAGEVSPRDAVVFGSVLMVCGLVMCTVVTPVLTLVGFGYLALTVSYTWVWRHVPVLDLVALAGGFVLRALAGGVAAPVGLSRWFVLVVTFAAVFVATGKRLAELLRAAATGARTRRVLRRYSAGGLRRLLAVSQAGALFAYCVWAFELPDVDGIPWRLLTVIPFTVCLLRYGKIVRAGAGEAPEEILVSDRGMTIGAIVWLVLFGLSVNAAG
jgi:decaprenyl-phosphate phosphoribosyltransferase